MTRHKSKNTHHEPVTQPSATDGRGEGVSAAPSVDAGNGQADPDRHEAIALAAYYRAEQRGFSPGCELEDWLAAEDAVGGELAGVQSD